MASKIGRQIGSRIVIGLSGCGLGSLTIMPNIMISDSGSPMSMCGAQIGLYASASFVGGGLLGAIFKKPAFLIPGVILQIGAFIAPPIISKLGLIEGEEAYWKRKDEERRARTINTKFLGDCPNPQITFFREVYHKKNQEDQEKS